MNAFFFPTLEPRKLKRTRLPQGVFQVSLVLLWFNGAIAALWMVSSMWYWKRHLCSPSWATSDHHFVTQRSQCFGLLTKYHQPSRFTCRNLQVMGKQWTTPTLIMVFGFDFLYTARLPNMDSAKWSIPRKSTRIFSKCMLFQATFWMTWTTGFVVEVCPFRTNYEIILVKWALSPVGMNNVEHIIACWKSPTILLPWYTLISTIVVTGPSVTCSWHHNVATHIWTFRNWNLVTSTNYLRVIQDTPSQDMLGPVKRRDQAMLGFMRNASQECIYIYYIYQHV